MADPLLGGDASTKICCPWPIFNPNLPLILQQRTRLPSAILPPSQSNQPPVSFQQPEIVPQIEITPQIQPQEPTEIVSPLATRLHPTYLERLRGAQPEHVNIEALPAPVMEDGVPMVTLPRAAVERGRKYCEFSLIGRLDFKKITLENARAFTAQTISPIGEWKFIPIGKGFFMLQLDSKNGCIRIWSQAWKFGNQVVRFIQWTPEFDPDKQKPSTTLLWVQFLKLKQQFWDYEILMSMGKGLGTPIGVDQRTLDREKGYFANVLVDMDLSKPIPEKINVRDEDGNVLFTQEIEIPRLPTICSHCRGVGHEMFQCRGLRRAMQEPTRTKVPQNQNQWLTVNRGRNRQRRGGGQGREKGQRVQGAPAREEEHVADIQLPEVQEPEHVEVTQLQQHTVNNHVVDTDQPGMQGIEGTNENAIVTTINQFNLQPSNQGQSSNQVQVSNTFGVLLDNENLDLDVEAENQLEVPNLHPIAHEDPPRADALGMDFPLANGLQNAGFKMLSDSDIVPESLNGIIEEIGLVNRRMEDFLLENTQQAPLKTPSKTYLRKASRNASSSVSVTPRKSQRDICAPDRLDL